MNQLHKNLPACRFFVITGGKMEIYLIRHGETEWNTLRKLQGRSDTELNEVGIQLAQLTS